MSSTPARPVVQPRDRIGLPSSWLVAMAVTTAMSVGSAGVLVASRTEGSAAFGLGAGVLAAVLAVFALPSVSVRLAGLTVVLVGAALAVRFGELPFSVSGGLSLPVLGWIAGTIGALVVANAIGALTTRRLPGSAPSPASDSTARGAVAAVLVILALVIVIAPVVTQQLASATHAGDAPSADASSGGDTSLRASSVLDMGTRPELSDSVVMTVDSDRPAFWRGETYDVWDGRSWFRTDQQIAAVESPGTVTPDPLDDGARGSDQLVQRFRIEARYADVVYAAPSAVRVRAATPVAQHADGTLQAPYRPMGRGATYTVTSRRVPVTAEQLRAAGRRAVPQTVTRRFAQPTVATSRVRDLATRLGRGTVGSYDKVTAIERWLSRNVKYSIDAPLTPKGRDVVDDFLFRSREGWCEQVASSLVVLLRAQGVPARLATGFVPDDIDSVSGVYTVREKDAHAWVEVYFPGVGWQPFDPTASVPLAGNAKHHSPASIWLRSGQLLLVLLVAGVALVCGPAFVRLVRRMRARRRPLDAGDDLAWARRTAATLDRLGRHAHRSRAPSETTTAYASALSDALHEPQLVAAGRAVDVATFAADHPSEPTRRQIDASLAEVDARVREAARRSRGRLRR